MSCNFKIINRVKNLYDRSQNRLRTFFYQFFTNTGPYFANNIPPSKSHGSFLLENFKNSIFFDTASEQEIIEICLSVSSGTAAGYDHASIVLVKDCAHFICRPSTHIINLSTTSGIVPDQPKITRGLPIFKSGDK